MAALRCDGCKTNWPTDTTTYEPCPVCEGPVKWAPREKPIAEDEARHLAFDAYYFRTRGAEALLERDERSGVN